MAFARWQATITDKVGNVVPNAQVEVRQEIAGSPLARLYSDRQGTVPAANPITGDANGYVYFHVTGGAYRITASKGAFSREWRYVGIGRNSESDLAGLRPQGAWHAEISYSSSDYIRHNERTFVSLIDENVGNEPPDAPTDSEVWMWVPLGENAELAIDAREEAERQAGHAAEWAQSDNPISAPAGGDGATDRSSKWHADRSGAEADRAADALEIVSGLASAFIIAENTFATKAAAEAWHPVAAPDYIRTAGYLAAGDGGGALYKRVAGEPGHAGKLSITPGGGAPAVWYELAETTVTPQMFGATGDGSDQRSALQALSAFINERGGGSIFFPKGEYFSDLYSTAGFDTSIEPLAFTDCVGLDIRGEDATISVKGDFNRSTSSDQSLNGMVFTNCRGVTLSGLAFDGNCDLMTRSVGVTEGAGHGLHFRTCYDVVVKNCRAHHFHSDGLYIRDSGAIDGLRYASKRFKFDNCVFDYNGRQGFSAIQLRGAQFNNCEFSWTGRSPYGNHSPAGGIDIEPNRSIAGVGTEKMDVNTGDIEFNNCLVTENAGSQFYAILADKCDNVRLNGCQILVGTGSTAGSDAGIFSIPGLRLTDCTLSLGEQAKTFFFSYNYHPELVDVTIRGCKFVLNKRGGRMLYSVLAPRVIVENCEFLYRLVGDAPSSSAEQAILFTNPNPGSVFRNNRVFVDASVYAVGGGGDRKQVLEVRPAVCEGNLYETNLTQTEGGAATAYFHGLISASGVRNERYKGTSPGTADTFRTQSGSARDSRIPYASDGGIARGSVTWDMPSIAAGSNATTTVTVTGATVGDIATCSHGRVLNGLVLSAEVTAADTVTVRASNPTGSAIDIASTTTYVSIRQTRN